MTSIRCPQDVASVIACHCKVPCGVQSGATMAIKVDCYRGVLGVTFFIIATSTGGQPKILATDDTNIIINDISGSLIISFQHSILFP